jgi:hypothetical protein
LASLIDKDVARLQIAVNQATLICVLDGVTDLCNHSRLLSSVQVICFSVLDKGQPPDELHREVGPLADVLARFISSNISLGISSQRA